MNALRFEANIPRYVVSRLIGAVHRPFYWSPLSCVRYGEVPDPRLPGPEWVRVRVRYGGICGSDLHLILLHNSPDTSALTSFPFVIGHENVGVVEEAGQAATDFAPGTRVVVEPILGCTARGLDPVCPACARGDRNLCERVTEGAIGAGLLLGACRDTGGSWGTHFVAHRSQLVRVPDNVSDENAVMVEPFATALHAVLRNRPDEGSRVLVIGAGVIGLCTIAALRAIGSRCRIVALAGYPHQARLARQFGADVVVLRRRGGVTSDDTAAKDGIVDAEPYEQALANQFGARLHRPLIGRAVVVGGADVTFECVGTEAAVSEAFRFTRGGGRVVLIGLASILPGVDWTPVWLNELQVHGSYAYGDECYEGQTVSTCQLAMDLMAAGKVDLSSLVTHRYPLREYRRAFDDVLTKRRSGVIKAVFDFAERRITSPGG